MAGFTFNLKGLEQTITNLDMANRKVNEESNRALTDGGEVVRSTIEANTPIGPAQHNGHAKDNVIKSNVITEGATAYKRIRVGYGAGNAWYMWFLEDGTYSKGNPKGIAPRRIVEQSMEQSGQSAQDVISAVMSEVIASIGGG